MIRQQSTMPSAIGEMSKRSYHSVISTTSSSTAETPPLSLRHRSFYRSNRYDAPPAIVVDTTPPVVVDAEADNRSRANTLPSALKTTTSMTNRSASSSLRNRRHLNNNNSNRSSIKKVVRFVDDDPSINASQTNHHQLSQSMRLHDTTTVRLVDNHR